MVQKLEINPVTGQLDLIGLDEVKWGEITGDINNQTDLIGLIPTILPTTSDLQEITDNGNTTSVGIVATTLNKLNTFNGDGVTIFNTGSNESVGLRQDRLFFNFGLGNINLLPNTSTLTSINLTLPPITGTIALITDITGTNTGTNTGDESTISIQTKRPLKTIEGQSLEGSGNIDLTKADVGLSNVANLDTSTTANITDSSNKRFVTDAQQTILNNTSGSNTGDNATNTQYSGLITSKEDTANKQTDLTASATKFPTVNAVNTGLGLKVDKTTTVNGQSLSSNVTLTTNNIADSTNKRYQTDNQQTFNDATSSIQTQLNGKISTTTADLSYTRNLFTQTTTVTTTNVTTETDLLSAYSIPANLLTAGGTIRVHLNGLYSRGAGTSTFRVYLGSTLIAYTASINSNNNTNASMNGYVDIVFRTVGVAGSVMTGGNIHLESTIYGLRNSQISGVASLLATTINTTVNQQIRVTHQFSNANAANTLSTLNANIILIKN